MKSAVALQARTAMSSNFFERGWCEIYRPGAIKAAGWNKGLGDDPKNEATGCKLVTGLVLTAMPELSAGSKGTAAGTTEASTGSACDEACEGWTAAISLKVASGRSAQTTPISKSRHKLVANAPIIPGRASKMGNKNVNNDDSD